MGSPEAEFVGPVKPTRSNVEQLFISDEDKAKRATICRPIMDKVMSRENAEGSCIDAVRDSIVLGLAETRLGMFLMEEGDLIGNGLDTRRKASERRVAEAMVATQKVAIDNKSIRNRDYRIAASQFDVEVFQNTWDIAYKRQGPSDNEAYLKLDQKAKAIESKRSLDEFERFQREAKSQLLLSLQEYVIRGEYK